MPEIAAIPINAVSHGAVVNDGAQVLEHFPIIVGRIRS
jgi:hypothetical protein